MGRRTPRAVGLTGGFWALCHFPAGAARKCPPLADHLSQRAVFTSAFPRCLPAWTELGDIYLCIPHDEQWEGNHPSWIHLRRPIQALHVLSIRGPLTIKTTTHHITHWIPHVTHSNSLILLNNPVMSVLAFMSPFTDKETKAQRGWMTSATSCSERAAEEGPEPFHSASQPGCQQSCSQHHV